MAAVNGPVATAQRRRDLQRCISQPVTLTPSLQGGRARLTDALRGAAVRAEDTPRLERLTRQAASSLVLPDEMLYDEIRPASLGWSYVARYNEATSPTSLASAQSGAEPRRTSEDSSWVATQQQQQQEYRQEHQTSVLQLSQEAMLRYRAATLIGSHRHVVKSAPTSPVSDGRRSPSWDDAPGAAAPAEPGIPRLGQHRHGLVAAGSGGGGGGGVSGGGSISNLRDIIRESLEHDERERAAREAEDAARRVAAEIMASKLKQDEHRLHVRRDDLFFDDDSDGAARRDGDDDSDFVPVPGKRKVRPKPRGFFTPVSIVCIRV
jgi:hypothetical protein